MDNIKVYPSKTVKKENLINVKSTIESLLNNIAKSSMIDKSISEVSEELNHISRSFKRLNKECILLENIIKKDISNYLNKSKEEHIDDLENLQKRAFNMIPFESIESFRKKILKLTSKKEKMDSLQSYHNELLKEKEVIEESINKKSIPFLNNKQLIRLELEIYLETLLEEINVKIIELDDKI
ncbi:MAG: hypothetical protein ACRC28_02215 [Clostridium sp.]|uniref:hypothetical protein n=1 Tax=Clostridium sp. TaxID=1506 RepID=UPI003F3DAD1A